MKNSLYHYRKANLQDALQLKQLALLAYGQYADILGTENWPVMEANLSQERMYARLLTEATCFVCEHENTLIGMIFLIPHGHPTDFFEADWAYIRILGIDPAHAGKGIGRALTKLCITAAKESGEKILALHTSEFQNAARYIYESLGFRQKKELDKIHTKRYWLYTLDMKSTDEVITYRQARLSDLEALIDLRIKFAIELGGEQEEELIQTIKNQLNSYFTRSFDNKSSIWFLAFHKNEAVGIGGIMIREQPANFLNPGGLFGYIINMYTVPDFRRKKICGTILELLVKAANRKGVTGFELHATKEGEFVYKQHGFKIHNEPTYRRIVKG